jgi:hypothetical protein
MPYRMCFSGSIQIPNTDNPSLEKIEELIKKAEITWNSSDEIQYHPSSDHITIHINAVDWNDSNDEMELFCLYVAQEYPHAEGFIDVAGEDSDDRWAMEIEEGKLDIVTFKRVEETRTPYGR